MQAAKSGLLSELPNGQYCITPAGRESISSMDSLQAGSIPFTTGRTSIGANVSTPPRSAGVVVGGTTDNSIGAGTAPTSTNEKNSTHRTRDLFKDLESPPPEERLETAFQEIQTALVADLLRRVKAASPAFFEDLVVDLLHKMGYGDVADRGARTRDGGIDGTINEDLLGLARISVQAKRWQQNVGGPILREFVGALQDKKGAPKGVFITTSGFTKDAIDYVQGISQRVVLIDGMKLAHLMVDHGVGVSQMRTYPVCRPDNDYFDEVLPSTA
jgi:restriction endonuclease Mrr